MFDVLKKNLTELGYSVSVFETKEDAAEYLDKKIDGKTVGFGGSATLESMGLYETLSRHNDVFWHWKRKTDENGRGVDMFGGAAKAEIYIASVNAVAETGEILNIDGYGNRVASIIYGHRLVYLVIGKNKITPDYDSAFYRMKNVAAPKDAQRLGLKTPCAVKADKCYNCKSPDSICRAFTVLFKKPMNCEYEILLVNEDMGF